MEHQTREAQLSVLEAAAELRHGRILMISSTTHRESRGVLCKAAQFVNSETISIFKRLAGTGIYAALESERYDTLRLPLAEGQEEAGTSVVRVEFNRGHEKLKEETNSALTLRALVDPMTRPRDLSNEELVRVLRAQPGGVLVHQGYVEGAVELMCIAGLEPGAALSEQFTHEDVEAMEQAGIAQISLETIVSYRQAHEVSFISETQLPTELATFRLRHYQEIASRQPYLVLQLGDIQAEGQAPLLRLHSACMTGDIFGSQRCDCQAQLHAALEAIAQEGAGLLIYLPQEGRGIGISAKLQAYLLQEQGYDTLEANIRLGYPIDAREYSSALEILHELGLKRVRLLTNNPKKVEALEKEGLEVERVALETEPTESNREYLQTKHRRMGHQFTTLLNELPDIDR